MPAMFIRVKPASPGCNLAHPAGGRPLTDAGDLWPDDGWTRRRIAEGGVTVVENDAAEPSKDDTAALIPEASDPVQTAKAAPAVVQALSAKS